MSVYFNIMANGKENNLEFISIPAFWDYFNKYKSMFKHYPRKCKVNGETVYEYNHDDAMKKELSDFTFHYFDLDGNKKTMYFDSLLDFKDHWETLDILDKPKIERDGDKVTYTYREDKMYQDFVATRISDYTTHLPSQCDEVRFVWIDDKGVETFKPFDDLAEFWQYFDGLSLKFEPEEFYDRDNDIMNYIYDVNVKNRAKKTLHPKFYEQAVNSYGTNQDQRVVY